MQQNSDWAAELRQLLAQPASQEIIARNSAIVEDIAMRMAGAGRQSIEADNSRVTRIDMSIQ